MVSLLKRSILAVWLAAYVLSASAEVSVNDSGTWRTPFEIQINDGGTWRDIVEIYVNDGGTWRTLFDKDAFSIGLSSFSSHIGYSGPPTFSLNGSISPSSTYNSQTIVGVDNNIVGGASNDQFIVILSPSGLAQNTFTLVRVQCTDGSFRSFRTDDASVTFSNGGSASNWTWNASAGANAEGCWPNTSMSPRTVTLYR